MTTDILSRPKVMIGGVNGASGSVTYYMHEGYDKTNKRLPGLDEFPNSGTFMISGRGNAGFSWPIYAVVRKAG